MLPEELLPTSKAQRFQGFHRGKSLPVFGTEFCIARPYHKPCPYSCLGSCMGLCEADNINSTHGKKRFRDTACIACARPAIVGLEKGWLAAEMP